MQDYTELFMKNVLHLKELSLFTKARRKMSKYKYYHKHSRFLRMFLQCLTITLLNSLMLLSRKLFKTHPSLPNLQPGVGYTNQVLLPRESAVIP